MKRTTSRLAIAIMALGILLGQMVCPAQAADEGFEKAVAGAWNAHDKAFSECDVDGVMATWIDAEDSVLLGSGPGERYVGTAEIREAYTYLVKDFDPYTLESVCGWHVVSGMGDTAWGSAECNFADSKGGNQRTYPLNISAVLVKQGGVWKFKTMHYSSINVAQ